jgi:exopolyphosphatase / guanosine-5'-triphosphate,3'-diphosphate pyrophosphatase
VRVAAVDCGTNTIRLLVADLDPDAGRQVDKERELRYVRLGKGVDRTRRLDPDAVDRTLAAAEEYAALIRSHDVERVRCGATSAVRDAGNAEEFLAAMTDRLGTRPEVLEGSEEARLAWLGAMRGLTADSLPADQLVVDIGGGSTELIVGDARELSDAIGAQGQMASDNSSGLRAAVSLDIGSVRLSERHLTGDPPTPDQVAAAGADADAVLASSDLDFPAVGAVVGVAGSITTIAAQVIRRASGDPSQIHHARLPIDDVLDTCAALLTASVEERRAMPFMPTGRADVIGGGAVVLDRLLRRLAPTLTLDRLIVSEHDILDGLAWSLVAS